MLFLNQRLLASEKPARHPGQDQPCGAAHGVDDNIHHGTLSRGNKGLVYFIADSIDQHEDQSLDGVATAPRSWLRLQAPQRQPGQDSQNRILQDMRSLPADKHGLILGFGRDSRVYPVQHGTDEARGMLR